MAALDAAVGLQIHALSDLKSARSSSGAWTDFKRQELDRGRLDPLERDGQHLLEALRRASQEISRAQSRLVR